MKTILCFGDSNTYGYDPKTGLRYDRKTRWPGHLQDVLDDRSAQNATKSYLLASTYSPDYPRNDDEEKDPRSCLTGLDPESFTVIEEGCNGRTTVTDDPVEGWKCGLDYLTPCLNSHKPVDIVILMLGTNDLKEVFHLHADQIARNAGVLVDTIRDCTKEKQGYVPKIILVSPPQIGEGMPDSVFSDAFAPRSIEESKLFKQNYRAVAQEKGCIFFDAASYILPSEEDSLHLTEEGHRILAEELAEVVLAEAAS